MNTHDLDSMDDPLRRIVEVFQQAEVPPRPSDAETLEVLSSARKRPAAFIMAPAAKLMKIAAPLAALAASVAVAIALWPASQGLVFAQVIEAINKADAVTFTMTLRLPGQPEVSGKAYAKSPSLLRCDFKSGESTTVNINDFSKGELISFNPASHEALIYKHNATSGFDIIRQLRNFEPFSPKRITDENGETDPNIDVFELSDPKWGGPPVAKVWVDKRSKLPVRMESRTDPGFGRTDYTNFDWNARIDDSMFQVPAGFKITTDTLLADPTEDELVAALRIRHAFSNEPYTADFLAKANHAGLTIGRLAYDRLLSRSENYKRQLKVLGPIFREIGVDQLAALDVMALQKRIDYLCMKVDQWATIIAHDGAWLGAGVRPGEQKPLCWWRKHRGGKIRVLYGDLTIHDADQPPAGN